MPPLAPFAQPGDNLMLIHLAQRANVDRLFQLLSTLDNPAEETMSPIAFRPMTSSLPVA
jgi:hypothetical protein